MPGNSGKVSNYKQEEKMNDTPKTIFDEYEKGVEYKAGLYGKGFTEQNAVNERFYFGDQWHGAACGNNRPLVRHNVIRRIGEYKIGRILEDEPKIAFEVPEVNTYGEDTERSRETDIKLSDGSEFSGEITDDEIRAVCLCFGNYFRSLSEKLRFDSVKAELLKDAFIRGTGILYTYWNGSEKVSDGVKGEMAIETLSADDVYFGDFYSPDVQSQPYIIISTLKPLQKVTEEARKNGISASDIALIKPESSDSDSVRVLTKLYKEFSGDGTATVKAVSVTEKVFIKKEWDTGLSKYPISVFVWERQGSKALGDSEITNLIPNQIAINRMLTASVWAAMTMGMPIMTVNGDCVTGDITNDPGQIIKIYGSAEEIRDAVNYVTPPDFTANFLSSIDALISDTLSSSGISGSVFTGNAYNNTVLANMTKEADGMSVIALKKRFSVFIEDTANVWCDVWLKRYGRRKIRTKENEAVKYLTVDADRYKNIAFTAYTEKEEKEIDGGEDL